MFPYQRSDLHDAIGVNLRNTTRSRRNAGKLEIAEVVVVLG